MSKQPRQRALTREIAAWAASLKYEQIPPRVIQYAKYQAASVFASAYAGLNAQAARSVVTALRKHAPTGNVPVLATGDLMHLDAALEANAALGMALDYDDYLFLGHTGHSAVWVPYLLGTSLGVSGRDVLCAQVVANEVAGRLGAACVFGPQNGQLWSHIHLAGATLAAGLLFRLNEEQLADALGIAYAQPPYALFPGFMGPGSKLLTAAIPIRIGLQAARYAQAGLTGHHGIFETEKGFLRHFAYRPIKAMLSAFGSAWVTETLAIKPYPGCAYIDTTIDTTLALRSRIVAERGQFDAAEVESISVAASLLTTEMDRLSHEQFDAGRLTPININFNIPVNVAIALLYGELTARRLADDALQRERQAILELSRRVNLSHDWSFTFDLVRDFDTTLGAHRFLRGVSRTDWGYIRARARRDLGHATLDLGWRDFFATWRSVAPEKRKAMWEVIKGNAGLLWSSRVKSLPTGLDGVDFSRVRMPFGSRVRITLRGGASYEAACSLPKGSAASGDLETVAREKLTRELGSAAEPVLDALMNLENIRVGEAVAAATALGIPPTET